MDAITQAGGASVVNAIPSEPSFLWRIAFCDSVIHTGNLGMGNTTTIHRNKANKTKVRHKDRIRNHLSKSSNQTTYA